MIFVRPQLIEAVFYNLKVVLFQKMILRMIFRFILLLSAFVVLSETIRFNYNLPRYQVQCFHETVEKDSRYQVSVRGETSEFYLHVVEHQAVHEDTRSSGAEYKHYSAFANNDSILTFFVGNLGEQAVYLDIQFYHGIFLEDNFEGNVQGREL